MKKTFTLLLTLMIISFVSLSQSIIPIPGDSASATANVTNEFDPVDVHIHVVNNFGQATSFMWMMKDHTAPSPWELKLCDNNNCYDLLLGIGSVYESLTVNAGDTMDMKFQYSPHCVNGSGNANVMIYVTGDSATTAVTLNYKADLTTSCLNAIVHLSSDILRVFPNPVQHTFTVSGLENAGNLSFEVYDVKGALTKTKMLNVSNSQLEISVENLPKGEYIFKAFDSNGKTVGTSKLNKVD